jgi:catechol 2,3-dioxygenase-like lactoylglutathione lyase family enzyme
MITDMGITDYGLLTDSVERSIDFYHRVLGLEIKRRDIGFAEFWTGDTILCIWEAEDVKQHLGKDSVTAKGHWFMGAFQYETTEEVQKVYDELKSKGVEFLTELNDWPWGARAAYFKDPDGYLWEIYVWIVKPDTW